MNNSEISMQIFYTNLINELIERTIKNQIVWVCKRNWNYKKYRIIGKNILFEYKNASGYFINNAHIVDYKSAARLEKTLDDRCEGKSSRVLGVDIDPLTSLYKQVPITNNVNICPFCGGKLLTKPTAIILCKKPNYTRKEEVSLGYCINCEIAFTDQNINSQVKEKYTGFEVYSFISDNLKKAKSQIRKYVDKSYSPAYTLRITDSGETIRFYEDNTQCDKSVKKTDYKLAKKAEIKGKYYTQTSVVKVDSSVELNTTGVRFVTCLNQQLLYDYYNNYEKNVEVLIPYKSTCDALKIHANYSDKNRLYYVDISISDRIINALKNTEYGSVYYINGKNINDIVNNREEQEIWDGENLESVIIVLQIIFKDETTIKIRVTNERKDQDFANNVFHYSENVARELLTAAFHKGRQLKGTLWGKPYVIKKVWQRNKRKDNGYIFLQQSAIRMHIGGGLNSSIKNSQKEIVAILLYSPFSDRYECINMTYDKTEGYCYVDPELCRKHIREHGNPGLPFDFGQSSNYEFDGDSRYDFMNTQSVLYTFGYSVSERNCLSDKSRHEILADIMDLEILTASKTLQFLEFFKSSHPGERYYLARAKWDNDIDFVKNYKVNPNRFLIFEEASKKEGY